MKVLLTDDEPDIRRIAKLSLEGVGRFQTALAASAEECIALARADRPDVIVLDMMMPGMDGMTALERIREIPELRQIPVIFLTARVQRADVENYLRRGAAGVIQKPFDPMTLPDQIREVVAQKALKG